MSIPTCIAVRNALKTLPPDTPTSQRFVWLVLSTYTGKTPTGACPGVPTLMAATGYSRATVFSALAGLCDKKLITATGHSRYRTQTYTIAVVTEFSTGTPTAEVKGPMVGPTQTAKGPMVGLEGSNGWTRSVRDPKYKYKSGVIRGAGRAAFEGPPAGRVWSKQRTTTTAQMAPAHPADTWQQVKVDAGNRHDSKWRYLTWAEHMRCVADTGTVLTIEGDESLIDYGVRCCAVQATQRAAQARGLTIQWRRVAS